MRTLLAVLFTIFALLSSASSQDQHQIVSLDGLKWIQAPTLPGEARMAIVHGNPGQAGPFTYRVKVPRDYKVPPHFHKASENVTVISGTLHMAMGEKFEPMSGQALSAGAFAFLPATMPHYVWTTTDETVIQVHGMGPTDFTFVNPNDDPRKK